MFNFVLGNRYRLLNPLGEGGMASVFAANDERLGRRVAVKTLSPVLVKDPGFIKRFQDEAEAAAGLSHPNIVSVFDVGQEGDTYYIVMELVPGRNLKDIILDRGSLPVGTVVSLGNQILDGLAFAHAHGLIHRDIKPQNILVTRDGVAKLADFGIAKAVDASSATQTAMVLGSAHYLSPEQAAGDPVSQQSDLYSVGVVLFEMLTGALPFDGSNLLAIASRHLHEDPPAPSHLNKEVPRSLDRLVLTALSKRLDERYPSCDEMKAALGAIEDDLAEEDWVVPAVTAPLPAFRPQAAAETRIIARPALFGTLFWALLTALLAVLINRSSLFLPTPITGHLTGNTLTILSGATAIIAVVILALGAVDRLRHRYTLDSNAVTVETGLLSHHRDAIPLPAIVNLQLHQNPVSRLLDMGTIILTTMQIPSQGPIILRVRDVAHVGEFYDAILHRIGGGSSLRYEARPMFDDLS